MAHTIEIDCAPMGPRPDQYIGGVLKGTGLKVEDFEITNKFFGNWEWTLTAKKEKEFKAAKPTLKQRITKLYNDGKIRYGSW